MREYFDAHPGEKCLVHEDGFIYYDSSGRSDDRGRTFLRYRNLSPIIRRALENDDDALKPYFAVLRSAVGKDVASRSLFPPWVTGDGLDNALLSLQLTEELSPERIPVGGSRKARIDLTYSSWRRDARTGEIEGIYNNMVFGGDELGTIIYEGRLLPQTV